MKLRHILMLSVPLMLAACNKNPLEVTVSNCPSVAVVGDIGTLVRFDGMGQDSDNLVMTASITNVAIDCSQRKKKPITNYPRKN